MTEVKVVGIDLAKEIFQVHGMNREGRELFSKRVTRSKLLEFVGKLPRCVIGMEACGGAQHWGREFKKLGHEVRLVGPQYVKAYVRGEKTDRNDAAAIAECVSRLGMKLVALKSVGQQEVQALHRVRQRLVRNRTRLGNELRGMMSEFGYVMGRGYKSLKAGILKVVSEEGSPLSEKLKRVLLELRGELLELDRKIGDYEKLLLELCREVRVCRRLLGIPGVGPITATAIWAHVGNALMFKNGRQFAAYLGLVPRQHSSGGKTRLLGISKRGDRYIRQLLVHGARAVIRYSENKEDSRSRWIQRIDRERGRNKACVALANKNARVIWALMTKEEEYRTPRASSQAA